MIGFLFPGFLYAAGAVALGVVALHFLVTQQPKSDVLPTVRFFPDVVARSTSVTIRPSDLWLLLLRVLLILLVGAAFAQPRLSPSHRSVARIVAVDLSRAVGSTAEMADSANLWLDGAATAVLFDDHAIEVTPAAATDSIAAMGARAQSRRTRGALTPAVIVALRAAARLRESADSIELVIVSPFAQEEADAALQSVRALLPGAVRAVRVSAMKAEPGTPAAALREPSVLWADSGSTAMWEKRATRDTIGAVRAGDAVLVFPFERRWRLVLTPDSATDATTRVYARWSDGEPAAIERRVGVDCIRSLGISMPTEGDAVLRPEFVRFTEALARPCGPSHHFAPLPAKLMSVIEGGRALTPTSALAPRSTNMTPLVPWLLAGALLIALLELYVRRRSRTARTERSMPAAERMDAA